MKNTIKGLLICNILLVLVGLFSYLSPYIQPTSVPIISILGLTYSGQLIIHLLFVLVWFALKPKYAVFSLTFLLLEIIVFNHVINIALKSNANRDPATFSVASYNMQFSKDLYKSSEEDKQSFKNILDDNDGIGILCIQEGGQRSKKYIEGSMHFPYRHLSDSFYVGIYSKFPIIEKGIISTGSSRTNVCLWVDVAINKDTFRVYSAHLESNRYDGIVPEVVNQEEPENVSSTRLMGILKHYSIFTEKRTQQARTIRNHINQSPYPVVLCGDFNDVPLSRVYRIVGTGMTDTFKKRGLGFGTTFNSFIPGLRIDYILTSPQVRVLSHNIVKDIYSDHFLVSSELQL